MGTKILNKIPMKVFQLYPTDERVTLLQACYDNPLFDEENGRFPPDEQTKIPHGDKNRQPRANDYHLPLDGIPTTEVRFKSSRFPKRKKIWIISGIVIAIIVLAAVIGLVVHFVESKCYTAQYPPNMSYSLFIYPEQSLRELAQLLQLRNTIEQSILNFQQLLIAVLQPASRAHLINLIMFSGAGVCSILTR